MAWQAAYQPFGTNTGTSGLFTQNLRFPGQYADSETGWYQNGFRDYNPGLGRYMESDPIGLAATASRTYGMQRSDQPIGGYRMTTKDQVSEVVRKFEVAFGVEHLPSGLHELLGSSECVTSRKTMPGHVTCTAVILNPDNQVLMVHHIGLDRWLFPGGHVEDNDEGLLAAARREATEETGIDAIDLAVPDWMPDGTPIDIDGHPIPESPGKGELAHMHFDFRFVFLSPARPLRHQVSEVHDAQWRPLRDAPAKVALRIEGLSTQHTPIA